jgi:hypothetical protein
MKRLLLLFGFAALTGGCASPMPDGGVTQDGVPLDSTYPGAGARIGIGAGRWGGHSGGGVGLGIGF